MIGEHYYTTVDINKYGNLLEIDNKLLWPTQEIEIPLTTPPKGRPNQKRPLSSPDTTPNKTTKPKKKKTEKNLRAESSISDNGNATTDDENTNEVARIHKIITTKKAKKTLTKEDFKNN